ncbi:Uncharacterized protein FKW44_013012, partial [Caligus rogercresseyi]
KRTSPDVSLRALGREDHSSSLSFKDVFPKGSDAWRPFILDCRSVSRVDLLGSIPELLCLLMKESVSQVWISVDPSSFMEIRYRLLSRSESDPALKEDALFKLILEESGSGRDPRDITRSGDEVRYLGRIFASVESFQGVCNGHPGLWGHVKKTSSHN